MVEQREALCETRTKRNTVGVNGIAAGVNQRLCRGIRVSDQKDLIVVGVWTARCGEGPNERKDPARDRHGVTLRHETGTGNRQAKIKGGDAPKEGAPE